MTLNKDLCRTKIAAAITDQGTPEDTRAFLESFQHQDPDKAGLSKAQIAAKVETFLNTDPSTWDLETTQKVVQLIARNWADIPNGS